MTPSPIFYEIYATDWQRHVVCISSHFLTNIIIIMVYPWTWQKFNLKMASQKETFLFGRPLAYMEFGIYSDKSMQLQRTQKAVIEMVVPFLRSRMTTVTHRMTPTGTNSRAPMNRDAVMSFDVIVTSSSEVTGRRGDVMWLLDGVTDDIGKTAVDGRSPDNRYKRSNLVFKSLKVKIAKRTFTFPAYIPVRVAPSG